MKVLADGENRYRLTTDEGRDVGWIRGRAVRVFGFASAEHVMAVAYRAWQALQTVLRRHAVTQRHSGLRGPLRLVRDGAYDWISDGKIPVARLHRPRVRDGQSEREGREASFAIELVVPVNASDRLAIVAARAIADAVEPMKGSGTNLVAPPPHFIP